MPRLKAECELIISELLGREIKSSESEQLIPGLRAKMVQLQNADPKAYAGWTKRVRIQKAAELFAADLKADAEAIKRRAVMQVRAVNRNLEQYKANANHGYYGHKSVARMLELGYSNTKAVRSEFAGQMIDALKAIDTKWLGMLEDPKSATAIVKELWGEDSGNAAAKAAAKDIQEVFEKLRQRYNDAGGDIKKLEGYSMPQTHDVYKLLHAVDMIVAPKTSTRNARRLKRLVKRQKAPTMEENRMTWVNFIAPLLDRSKYIDPETGLLLSDKQFEDMLSNMFMTLVTDGNTEEYGSKVAGGGGGRANRGSRHRAIHFKNADAYMVYEAKFGRANVMNTIVSHVNSMTRDIALLETFGPNPNATVNTLMRTADADTKNAIATLGEKEAGIRYANVNGALGVTTQEMWNVLNGNADIPAGTGTVATFFQGACNLQVAGKLGGAFISSFSDIGTYYTALAVNLREGVFKAPISIIRAFSKEDREFAARAGMLADAASAALCRWGDEYVGTGWTQAAANLTMRLSLLDGWTNGIRGVFAMNMMAATGKLAKSKAWEQLDQYDRMLLENNGVTAKDWKIWQLAQLENYKNCDFLTRQSIEKITDEQLASIGMTRRDAQLATTKLIQHINSEALYASLDPTLSTRTAQSRGAQKGTPSGEFWRSFMLFKSFPFDMMTRHFRRINMLAREGHKIGAVAYGASILTTTTLMGALSLAAVDLMAGRDVKDMTEPKFWGNAIMKGGGLGVFGDMLYNGIFEEGAYGSPNVVNFLGPIAGTAIDTWDLAWATFGAATFDEDTKPGAKALRLIRGNTPFINIWYVKNVLDHAVFNDLNEFLSPGYLRRQEQRARRTQGQSYWWNPRKMTPSRMPRMATMPNQRGGIDDFAVRNNSGGATSLNYLGAQVISNKRKTEEK